MNLLTCMKSIDELACMFGWKNVIDVCIKKEEP